MANPTALASIIAVMMWFRRHPPFRSTFDRSKAYGFREHHFWIVLGHFLLANTPVQLWVRQCAATGELGCFGFVLLLPDERWAEGFEGVSDQLAVFAFVGLDISGCHSPDAFASQKGGFVQQA